MTSPRVLVAGIGNIFLGDDGFGVAVVQRLLQRGALQSAARVQDFGIRGLDLVYTLLDGWDILVIVDAMQQRQAPGTLFVFEPELSAQNSHTSAAPEPHGMTPVHVFSLLQSMGGSLPGVTRIVGCEPESFGSEEDGRLGLSTPVANAVEPAAERVEALVAELVAEFRVYV